MCRGPHRKTATPVLDQALVAQVSTSRPLDEALVPLVATRGQVRILNGLSLFRCASIFF
jgi:hypothetical protein